MPTFAVRIPSGRIGNFLAGAVVASVIGGTAVAITSPDFTYSTTKTGYYSISPLDLAAGASPRTWEANFETVSLTSPQAGGVCFGTGIHLPQGAKILNLVVAYSSGVNSDPAVVLNRDLLGSTTNAQTLASATIADDTGQIKTHGLAVPAALSDIDNRYYIYSFGFCVGPLTRFHGARIAYTYTNAGD